MKKIFSSIIILLAAIVFVAAQTTESEHYLNLVAQQKALRKSQDSLQSLLASSREQLSTTNEEQKTILSADIVRFEGEIFDMRTRISRIGSDIAAIEEQYAESTLNQPQVASMQSSVLYQNAFFTDNLSKKDLSMLASEQKTEAEVMAAIAAIEPLYEKLVELKTMYDRSIMQSEVDQIRTQAAGIKAQIEQIDKAVGTKWNELYNYLIGTYLVMFDKAPSKDRATVEAIEVESREVRRAETFTSSGSLIPQLAAFDLQRKLLLSYERAIAKAASLTEADNVLSSRKVKEVKTSFPDIEFLPRVLTVYGPAMFDYTYPSDNVDDLIEMIVPQTGVYYSIQVALMSSKPKSVDMFKKVWPVQWQKTSDGKYRYLVGGFHSYASASKSVAALTKAGFKYPVLMAWNNGAATSVKAARAVEKPVSKAGEVGYKILVVTKNPAVAEQLKNVIDMHAKGKSIMRIAKGDELHFTVNDFTVREEAEVVAQILRERTEASITVEPIDGQ